MSIEAAGFVFKVLLWSTGLSLLVKYGGSYLALLPTATNALIIVFMPSLILSLVLSWRYWQ
ncbi:MAG: hypothetical protein AAFQ80_23835 [Cyanobacteria bacterium J06621_8]